MKKIVLVLSVYILVFDFDVGNIYSPVPMYLPLAVSQMDGTATNGTPCNESC